VNLAAPNCLKCSLGSESRYGSIDELGVRHVPDLPVCRYGTAMARAGVVRVDARGPGVDALHGKGSPWSLLPGLAGI
jgi:hypothetical protein